MDTATFVSRNIARFVNDEPTAQDDYESDISALVHAGVSSDDITAAIREIHTGVDASTSVEVVASLPLGASEVETSAMAAKMFGSHPVSGDNPSALADHQSVDAEQPDLPGMVLVVPPTPMLTDDQISARMSSACQLCVTDMETNPGRVNVGDCVAHNIHCSMTAQFLT